MGVPKFRRKYQTEDPTKTKSKRLELEDFLERTYKSAISQILSYFSQQATQENSAKKWRENAATLKSLEGFMLMVNKQLNEVEAKAERLIKRYVATAYKKGQDEASKTANEQMKQKNMPMVSAMFTLKHQQAIQRMANLKLKDIKAINEDLRNAIRKSLVKSADEGWSIDQTRKVISDLLTKDQKVKKVDAVVFGARIRGRAQAIARTSVIQAYAQGAKDHYQSLEDDGIIVRKEWVATVHMTGTTSTGSKARRVASIGRTCSVCHTLDGKVSDLDGKFRTTADGKTYTYDTPPAHPNCRCAIVGKVVGFE